MKAALPFPPVRLRALEPEDLDALYRIENDRQLWEVGATNVPYSRYVLHDYIATASSDIYADKQVRLVAESEQGQLVGLADLVNFDPRHLRAEVGIVIAPACRCRGYGHAVLHHLSHYARRVLHLHQLYAVVASSNRQANKLFGDMGFRCTAHLSDWLCNGPSFKRATLWQLLL